MGLQQKATLLAFLACCLLHIAQTEMFTALVELQKVLSTENDIAGDIRHYIKLEENRLQKLREIAEDYERHSQATLQDPEQYLSNPLNAFLLVKRFTTDWERVENLIRNNTADDFMIRLQSRANGFPNQEDLNGAASALLRLQDTYDLPTTKIALGELGGVKTSPRLTPNDCFELGRYAYNEADYYHTVLWMEEAFNLIQQEPPTNDNLAFKALVLDYLAYSTSMQGNTRDAYNHTLEWLAIDPSHVRAQNNKKFYEQQLAIEEAERKKGDEGAPPKPFQNKRHLDDYRASEEFQTYEALCRNEDIFPYKLRHKLTCQYRRHAPIFYIRPLKEEIMYFDPYIVVYHDVMTDGEQEVIKSIAAPRLERSGVFLKPGVVQEKVQKYRTSQTAWLHDWEHEMIGKVSTKVRYLSNLTLDTAEELQVVNYGIGGHYEPHYDFARNLDNESYDLWRGNRIATAIFYKREKGSFESWRGNRIATAIFYKDEKGGFDPSGGNRIATAIFYMTDVTAGGATVFTTLGVRLWPEKGSVALWYNLRRSGEGDYNTRHAGCPVLAGNKWVANKWIHERGQEFVRPCATDPEL